MFSGRYRGTKTEEEKADKWKLTMAWKMCLPLTMVALAVLTSPALAQSACEFRVPLSSDGPGCVHYSLAALDKKSGYALQGDGYSYVINVCDNVDQSGLPKQCASKKPAPGYQINNSCPILGELSSTLVVSCFLIIFQCLAETPMHSW